MHIVKVASDFIFNEMDMTPTDESQTIEELNTV